MMQTDSITKWQFAFNNHFAGFAPRSANEFLRLMDEPEVDLKGTSQQKQRQQQQQQPGTSSLDAKAQQHHRQQQTRISDFTRY
jgi:hypothetical protein